MEDKMVRLTVEAEGIAKQYGSTVSKGIIEMNSRIGKPDVNNSVNMVGQPDTVTYFGEMGNSITYWKTFDEHISKLQPISQEGFMKAIELRKESTKSPIKIIGKIDEDEKLVEPVGRQGRSV